MTGCNSGWRRTLACLLAGGILSLSPARGELTRLLNPDQAPEIVTRYPLLTAPQLADAPRIDGTIGDTEWQFAARSMPLVEWLTGATTANRATVWLAYTDQALCIAFRVERPAHEGAPLADGRKGDHIEVIVQSRFGLDTAADFIIDPFGNRADGLRGGALEPTSRQSEWSGQARLIPGGYEGEIAIPFAFFGRQMPSPGDVWTIQVLNHRFRPAPEIGALSVMESPTAIEDFAYMRFGGPTAPTIQFGAVSAQPGEELGFTVRTAGPKGGKPVRLQATLYAPLQAHYRYYGTLIERANPGRSLVEIEPIVSPADALRATLQRFRPIKEWETLLALDEEHRFVVPVDAGRYLLQVRLSDSSGGSLVAAGAWEIDREVPLSLRLLPQPLEAGVLAIEADYRAAPADLPPNTSFTADLIDALSQRIVATATTPADPAARQSRVTLPIANLRGGDYVVQARLGEPGRATSVEALVPVVLPASPAWWQNRIAQLDGLTAPPSPWTPLRLRDQTIDVWGRSIELTNQFLPAQITHTGLPGGRPVPFLAAPARLSLEIGRDITFSQANVTRTPWSLTNTAELFARGGSLRGRLTVTTEFDGFMRYSLSLSPVGDRPVTIQTLAIEIPLRRELAQRYHAGPFGTQVTGQPPAWQAGNVLEAGLDLPFTPNLWIGNDQVGLDLTLEWDRHWFPLDRANAIRLQVAGETAILRLVLIERDARGPRPLYQVIDGPVTFEWGLLPTPAKPLRQGIGGDVRLVTGETAVSRLSRRVDATLYRQEAAVLINAGANAMLSLANRDANESRQGTLLWNPGGAQPGLNPALPGAPWRQRALADISELQIKQGFAWVGCHVLEDAPVNWPDQAGFWHEMITWPPQGDGDAYRFYPGPVFQDWYLYQLRETLQNSAVNTLYLANSLFPRLTANPDSGTGWRDAAGNLRGKYPVFANRRFHQRLWLAMHGAVRDDGLVIASYPPHLLPTIESFVDLHVAGSHVNWTRLLRENRGELLARFYGPPVGMPVIAIADDDFRQPVPRAEGWGVIQLLNIGYHAGSSDRLAAANAGAGQPPIVRLWTSWRDLPIAKATWIPWWESGLFVKLEPEALLTALHLAKGEAALITVTNPTDAAIRGKLTLVPESLGFAPGVLRATDTLTQSPVGVLPGNVIELDLAPAGWRQFLIRQ